MPRKSLFPLIEIADAALIGGRKEQQDCFLSESSGMGGFAVVCDGMGGHSGGREAALAAVRTFQKHYQRGSLGFDLHPDKHTPYPLTPEAAEFALLGEDSGTTVVGVIWRKHEGKVQARLISVGDSYGLVVDCKGLQYTTPLEGVGNILFNYWSRDKNRVLLSPTFNISHKMSILLGSDGIDPITGNLGGFIRASEESLDEEAVGFLSRFPKADLRSMVEKAVWKGGDYADNTTLVRVTVSP
jgi:hypothetical protein